MAGPAGLNGFDFALEPVDLERVKTALILSLILSTLVVGCAVDPRWGPRNPTNPGLPGSPGVDARWGAPRNGLRESFEWQYEELRNAPAVGPK
jgi:hypothetical protein